MDVACLLVERGADMWRNNALGENPIQAVHEKADKKALYSALTVSMHNKELGFKRWLRRKNLAIFLSCYSLRLIPPASGSSNELSHLGHTPPSYSALIAVLKSKDLIRYISKYL